MPIFEENGQRYSVSEKNMERFTKAHPNATTIQERDGKQYKVSAANWDRFLSDFSAQEQPTTAVEDAVQANQANLPQEQDTNPYHQWVREQLSDINPLGWLQSAANSFEPEQQQIQPAQQPTQAPVQPQEQPQQTSGPAFGSEEWKEQQEAKRNQVVANFDAATQAQLASFKQAQENRQRASKAIGGVAEVGQRLNPETGEIEKLYTDNMTGAVYGNKATAQMAQQTEQNRQQRLDYANGQLANLNEQLAAAQAQLDMFNQNIAENPYASMGGHRGGLSISRQRKELERNVKNINQAIEQTQAQITNLNNMIDPSIEGQILRVQEAREATLRQIEALRKRDEERWREYQRENPQLFIGQSGRGRAYSKPPESERIQALRQAVRNYDKAIVGLQNQQKRENGEMDGFWDHTKQGLNASVWERNQYGFWQNTGEVLQGLNLDYGISDLNRVALMLHADEIPEHATEGEKAAYDELMQSQAVLQDVNNLYGQYTPTRGRYGDIFAQMPGFMVPFITTAGWADALKIGDQVAIRGLNRMFGKGVSEKLIADATANATKEAVEKGLTQEATDALVAQAVAKATRQGLEAGWAKEAAEKGIIASIKDPEIGAGKTATTWLMRGLGQAADDVAMAGIRINTVAAPSTVAQAIDYRLGDVVLNDDGTYSFEKEKSWGDALSLAELDNLVEFYSEALGFRYGRLLSLGRWGQVADNVGLKRLSNFLSRANASTYHKFWGDFNKLLGKAGVNDITEEVAEEYAGQYWRSILGLETAYTTDEEGNRVNLAYTGQFHGDIWGGMVCSIGLMSAMKHGWSAGRYYYLNHKLNKADMVASELLTRSYSSIYNPLTKEREQRFVGVGWGAIKYAIDNTSNANMGLAAEAVIVDPTLTKTQKEAIMNYMTYLIEMRGYNLAGVRGELPPEQTEGMTADQTAVAKMLQGQAIANYISGYESDGTPQDAVDARVRRDMKRDALVSLLGEDVVNQIDQDPMAMLRAMASDKLRYGDNEMDAVIDYINAKMAVDGMIQRETDDMDDQVAQSDAMIDQRTNFDTGKVQEATMNDNRKVYVVRGNVVRNEDGTINTQASDNTLVVRDDQTGQLEMVAPSALLSVDSEQDPTQLKEAAANTIRQQAMEQAQAKLNNQLPIQQGDTFNYVDENGNPTRVVVVPNADGVIDNGDGTINVTADGQNVFPISIQFLRQQAEQLAQQHSQDYDEAQRQQKEQEQQENEEQPQEESAGEVVEEQPAPQEEASQEDNAIENNEESQASAELREATQQPKSALEQIPVDEQGNPIYEQSTPATAWDALVKQTEGDENEAQAVADDMVKDKEKALKEAQKEQKKQTQGATPAEKIAERKARADAVAQAQRDLDFWNAVAGEQQRRAEEQTQQQAQETQQEPTQAQEAPQAQSKRKGERQIARAMEQAQEAAEKGDMMGLANAVNNFDSNVWNGAEATEEERATMDAYRQQLADAGYEVVDMMYQPYNEGLKTEADFVSDDSLPDGVQVITSVRQPQVNKDGKMVRSSKIVVTQGTAKGAQARADLKKRADVAQQKQARGEALTRQEQLDIAAQKQIEAKDRAEQRQQEQEEQPVAEQEATPTEQTPQQQQETTEQEQPIEETPQAQGGGEATQPKKGGVKAKIKKALSTLNFAKLIKVDKNRASQSMIYYKDGYVYVTDTRILVKMKMDYPPEREGKIYDVDGSDRTSIPNFDRVIKNMPPTENTISEDALQKQLDAYAQKASALRKLGIDPLSVAVELPNKLGYISGKYAIRLADVLAVTKNAKISVSERGYMRIDGDDIEAYQMLLNRDAVGTNSFWATIGDDGRVRFYDGYNSRERAEALINEARKKISEAEKKNDASTIRQQQNVIAQLESLMTEANQAAADDARAENNETRNSAEETPNNGEVPTNQQQEPQQPQQPLTQGQQRYNNFVEKVRDLVKKLGNVPVRMATNRQELLEIARQMDPTGGLERQIRQLFARGRTTRGFVNNGQVVIFTEGIYDLAEGSEEDAIQTAREVLAHEVLAHVGLRQLMDAKDIEGHRKRGSSFKKFCDDVFKGMTAENRSRFLAYHWNTNMSANARLRVLDNVLADDAWWQSLAQEQKEAFATQAQWDNLTLEQKAAILGNEQSATALQQGAADEYVASLAEKVERGEELTDQEQSVWQRIIDAIKRFFGAETTNGLTPQQIAQYLQESREFLQNEAQNGGEAQLLGEGEVRNSVAENPQFSVQEQREEGETIPLSSVRNDDGSYSFEKAMQVLGPVREMQRASENHDVSEETQQAINELRFSVSQDVGKKTMADFNTILDEKYPDMNEKQREGLMGSLNEICRRAGRDGQTAAKAGFHWFLKDNTILPDHSELVLDAMQTINNAKQANQSRRAKGEKLLDTDYMHYDSPVTMMNTLDKYKPKGRILNPNEMTTLRNKKVLPNGYTIYDVEDSTEGQKEMRKLFDSHIGDKRNIWCLVQKDLKTGELTDWAREMWFENYNKFGKKVAFRDGKLVAFFAAGAYDNSPTWWDLENKSYGGLPMEMEIPNDPLGRSATYEYHLPIDDIMRAVEDRLAEAEMRRDETMERINFIEARRDEIEHSGSEERELDREETELRNEFKYWESVIDQSSNADTYWQEYYEEGLGEPRDIHKGNKENGTYEEWDEDGHLIRRSNYKNGELNGIAEYWYENGQIAMRVNFKDDMWNGTFEQWYENGQLRTRSHYKDDNRDGVYEWWGSNGTLRERTEYKDGERDGISEYWDRNGNLEKIEKYRNGKLVSVTDAEGEAIPRFSVQDMSEEERLSIRDFLLNGEVVKTLTENKFPKMEGMPVDRIADYFKKNYDGKVYREGVGIVLLDRKAVGDCLGHYIGKRKTEATYAAFEAVPEVIKQGRMVNVEDNWKGRTYDGKMIVAPVNIMNKRYIETVIITKGKQAENFRFYLHRINSQKSLLNELSKTDFESGTHQEGIANILRFILSPNRIEEKNTGEGEFNTPQGENILEREGNGELNDDELSAENDAVSKAVGYNVRTARQRKNMATRLRREMRNTAEKMAERLHLTDVDILDNGSGLTGALARSKGFYNQRTGKITIIIGNNSSVSDVVKTVLHEAVAHHGLRQLFGTYFDEFLDNVYKGATDEIRHEIAGLVAHNDWNFRKATEEYLASLAERMDEDFIVDENGRFPSWWEKVKRWFYDMLDKAMGGDFSHDIELTDNELRYILWSSYDNLRNPNRSSNVFSQAEDIAMRDKLGISNYNDNAEASIDEQVADADDILMREGEARFSAEEAPEAPQNEDLFARAERIAQQYEQQYENERRFSSVVYPRVLARDAYERRMRSSMFQTIEAMQDSMRSLFDATKTILGKRRLHIEDLPEYQNSYIGENALSSVNQAEAEMAARQLFAPLLQEIARLAPSEAENRTLIDYMMAKHGLERNRYMAERDAQRAFADYQRANPNGGRTLADFVGEARLRDYAGLTALTGTDNVVDAEAAAEQMVADYENSHNTTVLWQRVRTVTDAILQKQYDSGLMTRASFDHIMGMYQNYIPLRGFDETTSDEVYAYLMSRGSGMASVDKVAKGRESKADDPIANLQAMMENAIMRGNRNVLVKQRFMNFAMNHPSDLISISDLWLERNDKGEWIPQFPDIKDGDTPAQVTQKCEQFEKDMQAKAAADPDRYVKQSDRPDIPYKVVTKEELKEHQVIVSRGGRDYVLTVNGNPRLAQAINGKTNPDNDNFLGERVQRVLGSINRALSAFYTTRNPDFIISNFFRDMIYSNTMTHVKEKGDYARHYNVNYARTNPAMMNILLTRFRHGTLNMGNEMDRLFYEFMANGGETGYASVRDIDAHKNEIQRELKKYAGRMPVGKALDYLGARFDELNRSVELCARFAAFVTSRQMGRTIGRAVYDAKEVSVNFNKKGAGGTFYKTTGQTRIGNWAAAISAVGRLSYVFWNAGMQGMTNFGRQFGRHPAKAIAAAATMYTLGALVSHLGNMGGGDGDDDDNNAYWNLPDYLRRTNILFRTGDYWISIPLPIEFRAFYGMGELMTSLMYGREYKDGWGVASEVASQLTQVLPLDFLEGAGGFKNFLPSSVKPLFEAVLFNVSWNGTPLQRETTWNQDRPQYTKAWKSANQYIVGMTEWLNRISGGNDKQRGKIDLSPAKIEYMLNGYFGGVFNTINELTKMGEMAIGKRDFDPGNVMLLTRILRTGDTGTKNRGVENEYWRIRNNADELKRKVREYEDALNSPNEKTREHAEKEGYQKALDKILNSMEWKEAQVFEDYRKELNAANRAVKNTTDDEERNENDREFTKLKREMLEAERQMRQNEKKKK